MNLKRKMALEYIASLNLPKYDPVHENIYLEAFDAAKELFIDKFGDLHAGIYWDKMQDLGEE